MRIFFGSDFIGNQNIFSITVTETNCSHTGNTTINKNNTAQITFSASSGFELPDTVGVTGATSSWVKATGVLTLSNPTGNVTVAIAGEGVFPITVTATNCTYSGDSQIVGGSTASLLFEADAGYTLPSTITVSGATIHSYDSSTGVLVLKEVTGNVSVTVTAEEIQTGSPIYGVSGMYSSSTSLTRTDDAVNMTYSISNGAVSSNFDSVFPWNETTLEEDANGNKFVKMPDMYFRIGKDSSNRITDIAVSKTQGESGSWYKVDSFYYGRYGGSVSNDKLASVSGVARQHSKTRAEFRAYASANGTGYHQLDLYHKMVMTFLWLIEFANKNSQNIMRGVDNGTARNTGGTDSLTTPSGYNTSTQQMRWHYIEDFVGNYLEFVDGSVGSGTTGGAQYVTADPSKFSDSTTGLNTLSYNSPSSVSNPCVSALGWDDNNPFLVLPKEVANNSSYNTYFCDYGSTSNNIVLCSGARWGSSRANNGVLYFDRAAASGSSDSIGGRLLYKP